MMTDACWDTSSVFMSCAPILVYVQKDISVSTMNAFNTAIYQHRAFKAILALETFANQTHHFASMIRIALLIINVTNIREVAFRVTVSSIRTRKIHPVKMEIGAPSTIHAPKGVALAKLVIAPVLILLVSTTNAANLPRNAYLNPYQLGLIAMTGIFALLARPANQEAFVPVV